MYERNARTIMRVYQGHKIYRRKENEEEHYNKAINYTGGKMENNKKESKHEKNKNKHNHNKK